MGIFLALILAASSAFAGGGYVIPWAPPAQDTTALQNALSTTTAALTQATTTFLQADTAIKFSPSGNTKEISGFLLVSLDQNFGGNGWNGDSRPIGSECSDYCNGGDMIADVTDCINLCNNLGSGLNSYGAPPNSTATVTLNVVDTNNVTDFLNNVSTAAVTATGGTVNGQSSTDITFVNGIATVQIFRESAGLVSLALSSASHPFVTLSVVDTALVHFFSQ